MVEKNYDKEISMKAIKHGIYKYIKRILDLIFSICLLIVFSPVILVAAIAIKATSKGPVMFNQKRPGYKGKIFTVYKLRTMDVREVDSEGKPLSNMERISKVGAILRKTSIDELPQLINIIKGEMSFIGPRPLLVEYLDYYSEEQMRRHDVLPGITGWAQVHGRNQTTWDNRFQNDIYYVDNLGFKLDLKIIVLTIKNVFKGTGVNQSENKTMEKFTGE